MQREEAYAAQHTYDKCFWIDVQAGDGFPFVKTNVSGCWSSLIERAAVLILSEDVPSTLYQSTSLGILYDRRNQLQDSIRLQNRITLSLIAIFKLLQQSLVMKISDGFQSSCPHSSNRGKLTTMYSSKAPGQRHWQSKLLLVSYQDRPRLRGPGDFLSLSKRRNFQYPLLLVTWGYDKGKGGDQ